MARVLITEVARCIGELGAQNEIEEEMVTGHYGAAHLLASSGRRTVRLWHLFVAVQLADLGWATLTLLHIERMHLAPGVTAAFPYQLDHIPYSHSLLLTLIWGVAASAAYFGINRRAGAFGAELFAAGIASHWVLDLLVHVPDLPLWPGALKVGFGLWNHKLGSVVVESGVLLVGLIAYLRAVALPAPRRNQLIAFTAVMAAVPAVIAYVPLRLSTDLFAAGGLAIYGSATALAALTEPSDD